MLKTQRVDELRLCATVKLFHGRWVAESAKLALNPSGAPNPSSSSSFIVAGPTESPRKDQALRTLGMLSWMVALLVEHAGLDAARVHSVDNVALQAAILAIAPSSPTLFADVFDRLVAQYHDRAAASLRLITLQSLGFLFRANPTLMLDPSATEIMDAIFERGGGGGGGSGQELRRLLLIFHDVLARQVEKGSEEVSTAAVTIAAEVDMTELIGNTEGFAESGYVWPWSCETTRLMRIAQRQLGHRAALPRPDQDVRPLVRRPIAQRRARRHWLRRQAGPGSSPRGVPAVPRSDGQLTATVHARPDCARGGRRPNDG